MYKHLLFIFILLLPLLFFGVNSQAKFAVTLEQLTIQIQTVSNDGTVETRDGETFYTENKEVFNDIKSYSGSSVEIIYSRIRNKKTIIRIVTESDTQ